ncbi:MAG: hypothetical protein Hyperionvirus21_8 [Hyperionvirus sp.]|uniref:Uncharacterized protein n=1 Tax=Hyperionvirus sp. TaxID=2487770 RepID=A0A3G5ACF8_9VIRU|nr:MAG: hypothetical protein Hyperionvirus21_8 [Hyperionvirus sp.]
MELSRANSFSKGDRAAIYNLNFIFKIVMY